MPSSESDTRRDRAEIPSAIGLLESGLNCIQQGLYAEGIAFIALARERLSPTMLHLTIALDACIQDYTTYWQARQALQQASESLVKAQAKQQAHVTSLGRLMSELWRDANSRHAAVAAVAHQSSQDSQMPPPLDEGSNGTQAMQTPALIDNAPGNIPVPGASQASREAALPALYFTCFGRFEVMRLEQTVPLCSNRNGQAILRYMAAQPQHRVSMDTLMALFWPEDEPDVAHHKLQVAMSALRRALNHGYISDPGGGYILCKNGLYQLNPAVPIRTDVDDFLACYHSGRQLSSISAAVPHYEAACRLYKGVFLAEDLYADWPVIQREQLTQAYLTMCGALAEHALESGSYEDAARWANSILKENRCDEAAHRQLMRINLAAGRRSEALRQYQRCERVLAEELNVAPMPETVGLFQEIVSSAASGAQGSSLV